MTVDYSTLTFSGLTHHVARLLKLKATPSETNRTDAMALCAEMMNRHDRMHSGDFTRVSICRWVGDVQRAVGLASRVGK